MVWPKCEEMSLQLENILMRVAADAKMAVDSKTQVARRICITEIELMEKLQTIRKAVAMVFPMGLPTHDRVKVMLDAKSVEEALADSSVVFHVMPEDTAELWWAGKPILRDQYVRDIAGENEKSTLVVQLQKKGDSAPSRELGVSEDEHKARMVLCDKKQQERQQATDDTAEDYIMSSWVDSKALKNSIHGTDTIRPF
ncbi:unnamed protein product [Peronospora belbahrii]|uniref:Uncharacterized protein n=1 Tax=Peronospora belbahrii TaxID=622444 RepID=A0ABN8DCA8_9STRA|nr:unnamed protein product [Peronospora belbahrii]